MYIINQCKKTVINSLIDNLDILPLIFTDDNYIIMWSCPGNMPKYYPGLRDILLDRIREGNMSLRPG